MSGDNSNQTGRGIWDRVKYAFRVKPSKPLSDEEVQLVQDMAERLVRKGMATPAILALESVRPLNFLGSQVMVAIEPMVKMVLSIPEYDRIRAILERRDGFELLIETLETIERSSS